MARATSWHKSGLKRGGQPIMRSAEHLAGLLAASARGDEAAFAELFQATRAKLFGIVLRILRQQQWADDVLQDAYMRIWTHAAQFDPARASPITWMATIARNRAIDELRKKREPVVADEAAAENVAAEVADPLAGRERAEDLARLIMCLDRLPAERRDLVRLAYLDGLSREQLAARAGAPVNTIKTWLRRSLLDLRECL